MKLFFTVSFLTIAVQVSAQLNNAAFDWSRPVEPADSGVFAFGVNTLGFTKNNEYFNKIADGYTLFGYQLNPYISYQPFPNARFDVGVYMQKDFGANGYETIQPTYSFKYKKHDAYLIFGTLDGSTSHRLVEPLYDFEKVLIDRLENGMQVVLDKERIFIDGWVDWQKMIYKGDDEQEEVTGGISIDYKMLHKENFIVSVPLQGVVFHRGGQFDDNPNPLLTWWNSAAGINLEKHSTGVLQSIRFASYYLYFKDFSFEKQGIYEDGSGVYLNVEAKTNFNMEFMASYWRGHEFVSVMGGQLYPSVSSTFKTPNHLENIRELLILRVFHKMKIADNLELSTRFEPFYDLGNGKFEFSHGFYLNYTTDFKITRSSRK